MQLKAQGGPKDNKIDPTCRGSVTRGSPLKSKLNRSTTVMILMMLMVMMMVMMMMPQPPRKKDDHDRSSSIMIGHDGS